MLTETLQATQNSPLKDLAKASRATCRSSSVDSCQTTRGTSCEEHLPWRACDLDQVSSVFEGQAQVRKLLWRLLLSKGSIRVTSTVRLCS